MSRRNKDILRIAVLGHKRIPSREGGVEIVAEELASRMAAKGHAVTAYNRGGHHVSGKEYDGSERRKEYRGIRLKNVFTVNKKGLAALTASYSAAIAAAFGKYDVVHFHAEGPCAAIWIPKLFGKRCIATIHGLDHKRAKWGRLAAGQIMRGEKRAVKYADEIIVLSKGVQDYFRQTYNRETRFIPNGIARLEKRVADLIKEKFGLEKDGYILFLGRLVPEKGLEYLIKAFKTVKTDKKLVIAGGSSDTDAFAAKLKELAEKDSRIIFTGFTQGRELEELYSNAYVYTLPSDLEGMPISLLEALSYGNCCLTSDIEECASVLAAENGDMHGFTFKKSDITDLAEKLQYLCDNQNAVQGMKNSASDYVCGRYNWDDVAEKTLGLYVSKSDSNGKKMTNRVYRTQLQK